MICCPLSSNDGDGPQCWSTVYPRARKAHECGECTHGIKPGSKYEKTTGIWDGSPDTHKTCLPCVEIRDHFACDGWIYGEVWNDIEENFFPDMVAGGPCLDGLSPAGKAYIFEQRLAWWERLEMEDREQILLDRKQQAERDARNPIRGDAE